MSIDVAISKELVMFARSWPCPDQSRTERFLKANNISYRKVLIDQDEDAGMFVEQYVGHRSVPTMVVTITGTNDPVTEPAVIPRGRPARSFDRGTMITEPSDEAIRAFLQRNGLIS
ncbi:MAG: hypothetical protein NVSMB42_26500 [Herpetosiphon sp.]